MHPDVAKLIFSIVSEVGRYPDPEYFDLLRIDGKYTNWAIDKSEEYLLEAFIHRFACILGKPLTRGFDPIKTIRNQNTGKQFEQAQLCISFTTQIPAIGCTLYHFFYMHSPFKNLRDAMWTALRKEEMRQCLFPTVLLGTHPRVGAKSAIRRMALHSLYEPRVWGLVRGFLIQ